MSIGDITILEQASMSGRGARLYNVAAGVTIYAGEPVMQAIGGAVTVVPANTNFPVSGSDYFVGIAATTSTATASTDGTVGVYPVDPLVTLLIRPKAPTSWDTQTEYNAIVGKSCLIDLTTGAYTLLTSGLASSGLVVQAMNVNEHPGMVAVAAKLGTSNLR